MMFNNFDCESGMPTVCGPFQPPIASPAPQPSPPPIYMQQGAYFNNWAAHPQPIPDKKNKAANKFIATGVNAQRIGLNTNYICPLGFFRICIILLLLGGLISAVAIPRIESGFYLFDPLSSTRTAYLVILSISVSYSILIFIVSITNFVNLPGVQSMLWIYAFAAYDLISTGILIPIGITMGVREAQVPMFSGDLGFWYIRQGTFAAACAFSLCAAIFYFLSFLFSVSLIFRFMKAKKAQVPRM